MNQRMLQKIKLIKVLENELKERNGLIENLNIKIEEQKLYFEKLDAKLKSYENNCHFTFEIAQLKDYIKKRE